MALICKSCSAALRVATRRSLISFPKVLSSSSSRSIHTSLRMSKEQIEELKTNPYFEKYANKIAKLQNTSPEEFLSRLAKAEEEKKEARRKSESGSGVETTEEKGFSFPSKPKKGSKDTGMLKEKKLADRMKIDLLEGKTKEEISDIWREYHVNKDAVSAVIPVEMFQKMYERFKEFKTFLFPLPRKQGYEFVVVQFEGREAHFTTLINFQAFRENAPECLTLVHYSEFAEDKGVVLMVGEYDTNVLTRDEAACLGVQFLLFYGTDDPKKQVLLQRFTHATQEFNHLDSIQEAQCLANQLELYYCNPSEEKLRLLQSFTQKPDAFKHSDLIAQLENVSLLAK